MDACEPCPCPSICYGREGRPYYCEWAAAEPADPLRIANICGASGRLRRAGHRGVVWPSLPRQAATLGGALWDWATAGFGLSPPGLVAERRATCGGCEQWIAPIGRCKICGCYTEAKIRMKASHCPLAKW